MFIFLFAVLCLFIQPYGWIVTLSLLVLTIIYYATKSDIIPSQIEIKLRIQIDTDEASDGASVRSTGHQK